MYSSRKLEEIYISCKVNLANVKQGCVACHNKITLLISQYYDALGIFLNY